MTKKWWTKCRNYKTFFGSKENSFSQGKQRSIWSCLRSGGNTKGNRTSEPRQKKSSGELRSSNFPGRTLDNRTLNSPSSGSWSLQCFPNGNCSERFFPKDPTKSPKALSLTKCLSKAESSEVQLNLLWVKGIEASWKRLWGNTKTSFSIPADTRSRIWKSTSSTLEASSPFSPKWTFSTLTPNPCFKS